ncbi:MAG: enoyl-CoA hydratase-related protein [Allosphingosinicella sp.]|uniref:enoyl-CoA hydratase-related protein n=1 Tax=Allosphingosinicella sp. TaxID=2823234 RepID=UPI0039380269
MAETESRFHSCTIEDGIATLTIDRPERLNALHPPAHWQLSQAFDTLAARDDIRVVIVTGNGRAFCAGYDIKDSLERGTMEIPPTGFGGLTNRHDFPHPIIAAVNGPALGGGFEIALACDLIVASSEASFALPEPRIGWAALACGVQRLPRAIGIKRALGIILTGRTVAAQEGLQLGFLNAVTAPELLIDEARKWAAQIAACAPLAVRCSREVAYRSMDMDEAAMLDMANFPNVAALLASEDSREGRTAFIERRTPVWSGR